MSAKIINRGRGPEIEGTRITVYDVLDYVSQGWHRDRIAALFRLSSRDIQAALDYIDQHHDDVMASYQRHLRASAGVSVYSGCRSENRREPAASPDPISRHTSHRAGESKKRSPMASIMADHNVEGHLSCCCACGRQPHGGPCGRVCSWRSSPLSA